jgi:hypothetical protein
VCEDRAIQMANTPRRSSATIRHRRPTLPLAAGSLVAALLVSLGATPLWAESTAPVELLARAERSYIDGELDRAKRLLLSARIAATSAELLARIDLQLGLIAAVLDDAATAEQYFRRSLSLIPTTSLDPDRYKPEIVSLFRRVRAEMQGRLVVRAPDDHAIAIDGQIIGRGSVEQALVIGEHLVTLSDRHGAVVSRRRVVIGFDKNSEIDWRGRHRRPAAAAALPATNRPKRRLDLPIEREKVGRRRVWSWVAAGAAGAAAAVAIGFGVAALRSRAAGCDLIDPDRRTDCDASAASGLTGASRREYEDLRAATSRERLVANIAWGAAGIVAVGALVLYFVEGRVSQDAPERSRVGLSTGGLTITTGF